MQQHKCTNKFSEIEVFAQDSETLTISLSEVMGKFRLKSHLSPFDGLKSKGLSVSSIVNVLTHLVAWNEVTCWWKNK